MLVNISSEIFEQSSGLSNRSKIEKKKTYVKLLLALKCEMQFKKFCIIKLTTQVVRRNRVYTIQDISTNNYSICSVLLLGYNYNNFYLINLQA